MKKLLLSILMAAVAMVASAAVGDTFTSGDLAYKVTKAATTTDYARVTVTGLSSTAKAKTSLALTIPTSVSYSSTTFRVASIENSAFLNSLNLTSVTVKYGTTYIGAGAFKNCTKITYLRLSSSVSTIATLAFSGCSALKTVYMASPDPTNVSTDAFPNVSGMTLYVTKAVNGTASKYKAHAAFPSTKFSSITAESNVYDVYCTDGAYLCVTKAPTKSTNGEMTMVGFNSNGSLVVDGEYKKSGTYSFEGYSYNLVSVAQGAFCANKNLKKFNVSGVSTLKTINNSAFEYCESLISVSLPSSLTTIENGAFRSCVLLTSLELPAGVTSVGHAIVDGCSRLQTINVSGQNTKYTSINGVLYTKDGSQLVRCPEGYLAVTKWNQNSFPSTFNRIVEDAFYGCTNIQEMILPYGVWYIGSRAFNKCTKLTYVSVPSSVTFLGVDVFTNSTALTTLRCNIATPPTLSSLEFSGAQKKYLCVPYKSLSAYKAATGWKDWTNIKPGAYDAQAQNLESESSKTNVYYTIHSAKPETINGTAYDGRAQLSYVPNVSNSDPLWTINLPASITVKGKTYAVTSIAGQVLPDGMVKNFRVALGENIDSICDYAFQGYDKIVAFTPNPNLKYLGMYAFDGCRVAGKIDLPYGLKYIGANAFKNCPMTHLLVPSSVSTMNYYAFNGLWNLSSLVLNLSWPIKSDRWVLTDIPTSCRLYVPSGYVNHYAENSKFRTLDVTAGAYDFTFKNTPMDQTKYHITITSNTPVTVNGVTYDGKAKYVCHPAHKTRAGMFVAQNMETNEANGANKKYLMVELGDSLLDGCSAYTSVQVHLMKALERIGNYAFYGTGIEYFTVPESVTHIGKGAFDVCRNLKELIVLPASPTLDDHFFLGNHADFKCYVKWTNYSDFKSAVASWPVEEGEQLDPVYRLCSYLKVDNNVTATSFCVDHPVDWEKSGLKAYVVSSYNKSENKVYTTQRIRTRAATGVLVEGFEVGKVHKIERTTGPYVWGDNLLEGTTNLAVNVFNKIVGFCFDRTDKYFWRPTSAYNLGRGYAYLRLPLADGASVTRVEVDRWAKAVKGDVNGDGQVNVSDVTALINKILGTATYTDTVCDINADGQVNVSDVTALINMILG